MQAGLAWLVGTLGTYCGTGSTPASGSGSGTSPRLPAFVLVFHVSCLPQSPTLHSTRRARGRDPSLNFDQTESTSFCCLQVFWPCLSTSSRIPIIPIYLPLLGLFRRRRNTPPRPAEYVDDPYLRSAFLLCAATFHPPRLQPSPSPSMASVEPCDEAIIVAPQRKSLAFLDLPLETQKDIFSHVRTRLPNPLGAMRQQYADHPS